MAWISVDQKLIGGKLRSLYKSIGCSQNEAMGILVFLWLWGIDNAGMDGLIVSADRSDIADVLKPGLAPGLDAETVVEILIQNRWIDEVDGELYFHDWSEWRSYYNKYIKDKRATQNARQSSKRERDRKQRKTQKITLPMMLQLTIRQKKKLLRKRRRKHRSMTRILRRSGRHIRERQIRGSAIRSIEPVSKMDIPRRSF